MKNVEDLAVLIRNKLTGLVRSNPADGIIFSGGLDSSVLAALDPAMQAITVSFCSQGRDIHYSGLTADYLGMNRFLLNVDVQQSLAAVPRVIKILKSFDPAIPNDLVVYFALKQAKKSGIKKIMAGDGSDELLAGYSYMQNMPDLENYIRRISRNMWFSSNILSDYFGIELIQPFMNPEFVDLALSIPRNLKINEYNGKFCGKWILRKAFEGMLPFEIIWQDKRPLEYGSGMTQLRKVITEKVEQEKLENHKYNVKFINKEHVYYYKIYNEVIGNVPVLQEGEEECPACLAGIKSDSWHCRVCGWVKSR